MRIALIYLDSNVTICNTIVILLKEKNKSTSYFMEVFMRTAIMTDTNSGLSKTEAFALGVTVVPMPVIIEGETYFEGETISEAEFYDALCSGKKVTTSMPAPGDLMHCWDVVLEQGYDEIVYIPMSSGLSNSCQAAAALAGEYENRVYVVDNHRISVPLKESIYTALKLAEQGMKGAMIQERLEQDGRNASIYIAVDTLEYLRKGGRVTPAGAALASALNIKPILTIQGEKLDSYAKARGMKKALNKMIEALEQDIRQRFSDGTPQELPIGIAGTRLSQQEMEQLTETVKTSFPGHAVHYEPLSLSIGCHIGPKAFGLAVTRTGREMGMNPGA